VRTVDVGGNRLVRALRVSSRGGEIRVTGISGISGGVVVTVGLRSWSGRATVLAATVAIAVPTVILLVSGWSIGAPVAAGRPPAPSVATGPVEVAPPSTAPLSVPPSITSIFTSTTSSVPAVPTRAQCIGRAPTADLVGQLVVATITEGGIAELAPRVVDGTMGGIVLLGDADSGIADAIAPLDASIIPPIVGVDEEGGAVQRLEAVLGYAPSARRLGDAGNVDSTFFAGARRGTGAAALGFNMVLAPVLDIGRSAGLRSRTYGDDPDTVIAHGLAYARGLEAGGVVAVAKHFPGHGSTGVDSHQGLPVTAPLADLESFDLLPFAAASSSASVPAIMIGHLVVPDLTDGMPASLSRAAVTLLRDDYGFDGLIVSDDLSMAALRQWTIPEAAELALNAGDDLLIAGGFRDALATVDRLTEAVGTGRVSRGRLEDAASRVLRVKGVDPCDVWAG